MTAANENLVNWLFLDLNSYFASVEQQLNPKLRGKPVAVVPMLADTTCAIAASYEAKKFGIKTGTLVREAKRMCPGLILIEARHREYIEFHEKIVEAVESCVPVDAVCSIDEMACRLTGSQKKVEVAMALAVKVKRTVEARVGECMKSSVGLAPNRYLAKLASDLRKPDGLTVLLKKDLPGALTHLKLRDLSGIGPAMEERLHRQGIYTMEKLCRLSAQELEQAWGGIGGTRLYQWLRGEETFEQHEKNQSVNQSHVLPPEERDRESALAIAKKLTTKACARMREMGSYASHFSLSVKFSAEKGTKGAGDSFDKAVRIPQSAATPVFIQVLNSLWNEIPSHSLPIYKVGIALSGLVPENLHTPSLFESPKLSKVSHLMDEINSKFGKQSLYYGGVHGMENTAPTRIAFSRIPGLEE